MTFGGSSHLYWGNTGGVQLPGATVCSLAQCSSGTENADLLFPGNESLENEKARTEQPWR